MAGTILIGFDDSEGAGRALDRAIAEASASGDMLVVLSVFEMLLDPEGPQNFGNINEGAEMMPLVEPPELEPILARARERVEAAGLEADYVWAVGNAADKIAATARDRGARMVVLASHHHGFLSRLLGTDVAVEVERELGSSVVVVD
jgi:nucleotide-binding universal stress UspA family protein